MASVLVLYEKDAADLIPGVLEGTRVAVGVFSVDGQPFTILLDGSIMFLSVQSPSPLRHIWFDTPLILPPGHTLEVVPYGDIPGLTVQKA